MIVLPYDSTFPFILYSCRIKFFFGFFFFTFVLKVTKFGGRLQDVKADQSSGVDHTVPNDKLHHCY